MADYISSTLSGIGNLLSGSSPWALAQSNSLPALSSLATSLVPLIRQQEAQREASELFTAAQPLRHHLLSGLFRTDFAAGEEIPFSGGLRIPGGAAAFPELEQLYEMYDDYGVDRQWEMAQSLSRQTLGELTPPSQMPYGFTPQQAGALAFQPKALAQGLTRAAQPYWQAAGGFAQQATDLSSLDLLRTRLLTSV